VLTVLEDLVRKDAGWEKTGELDHPAPWSGREKPLIGEERFLIGKRKTSDRRRKVPDRR
jgi:hypothetical protein